MTRTVVRPLMDEKVDDPAKIARLVLDHALPAVTDVYGSDDTPYVSKGLIRHHYRTSQAKASEAQDLVKQAVSDRDLERASRNQWPPRRNHLVLDKPEVLGALYHDAGWTQQEVAEACGCTDRCVLRRLHGHGLL